MYRLQIDPPWDLTWSQGILTDGFWYTDSAVSKVTGVTGHLTNTPFNQKLYTWFATFFLSLIGVGLAQIGLISIVPGILAIVLLGQISKKAMGKNLMLLSSALLACNYFFIFYNRIPKVYSLIAFLCTLALWLLVLSITRPSLLFLSFLVILLTATYLKFFTLLLLPFVVLAVFQNLPAKERSSSLKKWAAFLLLPFLLFLFMKGTTIWGKLRGYNFSLIPNPAVFTKIPVSNWIFVYSKMLPEVFLASVLQLMQVFHCAHERKD